MSAPISDSTSVFQFINVMQWSCSPSPTGQVLADLDLKQRQLLGGADAREHQQLR